MRKEYINPEMEIVELQSEDILETSGGFGNINPEKWDKVADIFGTED